jgi:hypothetical protein
MSAAATEKPDDLGDMVNSVCYPLAGELRCSMMKRSGREFICSIGAVNLHEGIGRRSGSLTRGCSREDGRSPESGPAEDLGPPRICWTIARIIRAAFVF